MSPLLLRVHARSALALPPGKARLRAQAASTGGAVERRAARALAGRRPGDARVDGDPRSGRGAARAPRRRVGGARARPRPRRADRRRRLRRRHAGHPARRLAARARGDAARGRAAEDSLPGAVDGRASEPACRLGPCRGARSRPLTSVALAKALAPPPVAAEWCLPLVAEGGAVVLWVGPSAEPDRVARVAERVGGELAESPPGFLVLRKVSPTPPGFPRRPGVAKKRPLA